VDGFIDNDDGFLNLHPAPSFFCMAIESLLHHRQLLIGDFVPLEKLICAQRTFTGARDLQLRRKMNINLGQSFKKLYET